MFKYPLSLVLTSTLRAIVARIMGKLDEITTWPLSMINFKGIAYVGTNPPEWWTDYDELWVWYQHRDSQGRPDDWMCYYYTKYTWNLWRDEIRHAITWVQLEAQDTVRDWIGWVQHGFGTFEDWIADVYDRVGDWLPWWATSIAQGLSKLYYWFPLAIRTGREWLEWLDDEIIQPVKDWVKSKYDWVVSLVEDVWDWIEDKGKPLVKWWDNVRAVISAFVADPFGFILGVLGVLKAIWTAFWSDPIGWICSVWGLDRAEVANFFNNPVLWFLDKLHTAITTGGTGIVDYVAEITRRALLRLW